MAMVSPYQMPKMEKCPHKRTDFRYELWLKERRALYAKAKKNSFRVEMGPQPKKGAVTVDTSKARSNIDVLRLCLKELGWREFPFGRRDGGECDLYWNGVHFSDCGETPTSGKVNKLPGMVEVVRKVNLGRTLDIMQTLYPEEYDFHPMSWFLPQQFAEFSDAVRRLHEKRKRPCFIVKPDEGSQGEGIYLIHEPREYTFQTDKSHIVQEYIALPLLLDNLKFDFRVYVILTSLDPVEIYICKEGLARFCTIAYQYPTNKNIHDVYMHLTNYSLNKRSSTYLHTESGDDGSKRTMSSVLKWLDRQGYNTHKIWLDIEKLVVKTILAMVTELRVEYRAEIPPNKPGPTCFQILGFDVLLTEDGEPKLLEVNANPSLRIDFDQEVAMGVVEHIHSPVDEEIKRPLVMDVLLLVAPRSKSVNRYIKRDPKTGLESEHMGASDEEDLEPIPNPKANEEIPVAKKPTLTPGSKPSELPWKIPKRKKGQKGYGTLEQIYPAKWGEDYSWLCILDRAAEIFLDCLGIRGSLRMGPTSFRNFTRRCRLTGVGTGFTNAALDILYIDLQRRWEHCRPERGLGLCYQAFIEAFFHIAKRRFPGPTTLESVQTMMDFCETNIKDSANDIKPKTSFPRIAHKDETRIEQLKQMYGKTRHRSSSYLLDYRTLPNVGAAAGAASNNNSGGKSGGGGASSRTEKKPTVQSAWAAKSAKKGRGDSIVNLNQ